MRKMQMRGFLNPLEVFLWEPEFLLSFLCALDAPKDMSELKKRYEMVSKKDQSLLFSFEEPEIKENLFEPLRQAKVNYILGNYVGTIALCGIVAEKLAILIHNMHTCDETKRANFEKKWGQQKRLDHLKNLGLIDTQARSDFGSIKAARDEALHHWIIPKKRTAQRTAQVFALAMRLVRDRIGLKIVNGTVVMNPDITRYLEERGEISV